MIYIITMCKCNLYLFCSVITYTNMERTMTPKNYTGQHIRI